MSGGDSGVAVAGFDAEPRVILADEPTEPGHPDGEEVHNLLLKINGSRGLPS